MIMIVVYAFMINDDLSDNMVRFHVIANSDEAHDQELKLKVRDAVLAETAEVTAGAADKNEAVMAVNKHKSRIIGAAEQVIKDNGYDYNVRFEYGNYFFPEKKYDNIELPSGRYDAVRIKIGKAEGQNWWCVLFPPLCTKASANETDFKRTNVKENDSKVFTNRKYTFRFKLLEFFW